MYFFFISAMSKICGVSHMPPLPIWPLSPLRSYIIENPVYRYDSSVYFQAEIPIIIMAMTVVSG